MSGFRRLLDWQEEPGLSLKKFPGLTLIGFHGFDEVSPPFPGHGKFFSSPLPEVGRFQPL